MPTPLATDIAPRKIQKYIRHAVRATIREMYQNTPYYRSISSSAEEVLNELLPVVKQWYSPLAVFGFERSNISTFRLTVAKAIRLARSRSLEECKPAELGTFLKPIPFAA